MRIGGSRRGNKSNKFFHNRSMFYSKAELKYKIKRIQQSLGWKNIFQQGGLVGYFKVKRREMIADKFHA